MFCAPRANSGYYGSSDGSPHGGTPDWLLDELREEWGELFDPCPNDPNFDGLEMEWPLDVVCYVNPPYTRGHIQKWAEKCHLEYERGATIILLIPPYTCTAYFHDHILPFAEVRFLRGRLRFKGYSAKAANPSIICIYRGDD